MKLLLSPSLIGNSMRLTWSDMLWNQKKSL